MWKRRSFGVQVEAPHEELLDVKDAAKLEI